MRRPAGGGGSSRPQGLSGGRATGYAGSRAAWRTVDPLAHQGEASALCATPAGRAVPPLHRVGKLGGCSRSPVLRAFPVSSSNVEGLLDHPRTGTMASSAKAKTPCAPPWRGLFRRERLPVGGGKDGVCVIPARLAADIVRTLKPSCIASVGPPATRRPSQSTGPLGPAERALPEPGRRRRSTSWSHAPYRG